MALGKLQLVANGHLLALHFGTSNLGPSLCKGSTAPISAPWGSSRTRIINGANFRIGSLDDAIAPNALRRKWDLLWSGGGFSLGLDLGLSRTGVALSKGFSFRPLTVLEMRGQKLELRIIEIAEKEEADEFIIGLPKSSDGKETPQSNKVRSVAGRLAVRAAERGWRVYLQDEHGTSVDAMNRMINLGVRKSARQGTVDAYAAVMVLERYFSASGEETELVLPKQQKLQKMIRKGPPKDDDFFLL